MGLALRRNPVVGGFPDIFPKPLKKEPFTAGFEGGLADKRGRAWSFVLL